MKTPGRSTEVANYIIEDYVNEEENKFGSIDKLGRIYNNASIDNYMDV